jgi:hypothetical protein
MLTEERREEIRRTLDKLTDPRRLPIDNVVIEEALVAMLRALLELDAAAAASEVEDWRLH